MNENETAGAEALFSGGGNNEPGKLSDRPEVPFQVCLKFKDSREETRTFMSDFARWTILKLMREYSGVATVTPVDTGHKVL